MTFGDGIDWGAEARRQHEAEPVWRPGKSNLIERVMALVPPPAVVLDCGCNIGRYCPLFRLYGYRYVGVDQSAEALTIARERSPGVVFVHSLLWDFDAEELGFAPFGVACSNAVLQHNLHEEKEHILPRIHAALRPGGAFVMQESTVVEETRTQLTREGWIDLFARHGFELVETWHPNHEYGIDDNYLFRRI